MPKITPEELLKDRRVIEEVKRHLWIESERVGFDIGFKKASQDWIQRFSTEWVKYHLPGRMYLNQEAPIKRKTRRAKSYSVNK